MLDFKWIDHAQNLVKFEEIEGFVLRVDIEMYW